MMNMLEYGKYYIFMQIFYYCFICPVSNMDIKIQNH